MGHGHFYFPINIPVFLIFSGFIYWQVKASVWRASCYKERGPIKTIYTSIWALSPSYLCVCVCVFVCEEEEEWGENEEYKEIQRKSKQQCTLRSIIAWVWISMPFSIKYFKQFFFSLTRNINFYCVVVCVVSRWSWPSVPCVADPQSLAGPTVWCVPFAHCFSWRWSTLLSLLVWVRSFPSPPFSTSSLAGHLRKCEPLIRQVYPLIFFYFLVDVVWSIWWRLPLLKSFVWYGYVPILFSGKVSPLFIQAPKLVTQRYGCVGMFCIMFFVLSNSRVQAGQSADIANGWMSTRMKGSDYSWYKAPWRHMWLESVPRTWHSLPRLILQCWPC